MRTIGLTILLTAIAFGAHAQSQQQDGEKLVYVQQKYVSAEGLTHAATEPANVTKWLGWGKEIGTAMNEGLAAVVNQAERFGTTKVGNFVMVMIAWKIIGKDVVGIVLGIPILIAGICIWMWALRRFFLGYRVVVKREGFWKKEYAHQDPYDFKDSEWRAACGFFMFALICVWVGVMLGCVIF